MNQLRHILLGTLALCLGSVGLAADRWETLHAINMVENPHNYTGYGAHGELGPYQFRSSTWKSYSKKPFRMANDRSTADEVAIKHYEWLKKRLTDAGIDASTYNIAMAWNCGITAVVNGRIPVQSYHYAERVNNLAEGYAQAKAVAQPEQLIVVKTTQPAQVKAQFALSLTPRATSFRIVDEPIKFRVAGATPLFVLPPKTGPMFVFAAN